MKDVRMSIPKKVGVVIVGPKIINKPRPYNSTPSLHREYYRTL